MRNSKWKKDWKTLRVLLNNIVQSLHPDRPLSISVFLSERDDAWCLTTVKAYHCRNRKNIFERFIRGENKKHAVRGQVLAIRSQAVGASSRQAAND
ncbi:hypothetical protein M3664_09215 [Paenibacillus lautus]|uniref:hypothetical protein n=1 Tax=Bacillales TaxID=1385 RepID=UPI00203AC116|nr:MULTISPECIES: hypothetical protein [Paenibacillus]MCM3257966.1 hypothetical protein [Paenibacillus lautus]